VQRAGLKRLAIGAGSAGAIILAILIATAGSGPAHKIRGHTKSATDAPAQISALVAGLPQRADVLGARSAPVTLQYFGDLQCPFCREFSLGALPSIVQRWVKTRELKIEYLSLETATRQPEVFRNQQVAALAAGRQNRMWDFVALFYREQRQEGSGYVTESYLQKLAQQVPGLDLSRWMGDRSDPALVSQLASDSRAAERAGVTGTPSFLIGRTGDASRKLHSSSLTDPSSFDAAIERLLHTRAPQRGSGPPTAR
jgi:protein-disulfide isomerase